ncbi:hypothetical protein EW146_g9887, partial [Bondarzewia mesenterica]
RRVGKLPELIEYHNETVRELEKILVRYLKGGKISKERPTIRIGGFWGMGGTKKDAIDFYTAKLQQTEQTVEEYRGQIDTRKPENYGFASMAAVPYAHIVARILQRKRPKGATVMLAMNPKDIIWDNLNKSDGEIMRKKTMGWVWLVVVCFFNTVPLFAISILANLSSLTSFVPFLQNWSDSSPKSFNFISGVLPPAVSAMFGFFLPITMRWLSRYQGAITHSRLDRAVLARYFAFLVISQLIIFTLIGVMFNSVKEIIDQIGQHNSFQEIVNNLDKLPATINRTYIDQASYWLTFFPLRGFLAIFDLAQIINLVWIFIKTHLFGRTPRDIREWTQPPEFQYAIYYANILFMGTVGLVFAPLAPLVAAAAAIVFWISSWVYKYQLMFVFVSKVETGGRMWNPVVNRLLMSLMLMQALMVLTIGLQYGWTSFAWVATVPPFIIVMLFKMYINRVFDNRFRYYNPTEEELRLAKVHSQRADLNGNRLEKRFGHPALHAELFTPMLHASMMPLLSEVYKGKISHGQAKMEEYGGQAIDAQQNLEYDPALYQRDRGELDWDNASTNMMSDTASLYPSKGQFYEGGRASPAPSTRVPGYEQYIARGLHPSEIELSRLDLPYNDQQPLLPSTQSSTSLPGYASPYDTPPTQYPPVPAIPAVYQGDVGDSFREAPVHRPYLSRQGSSFAPSESGDVNMAGRGIYRAPLIPPIPMAPSHARYIAGYHHHHFAWDPHLVWFISFDLFMDVINLPHLGIIVLGQERPARPLRRFGWDRGWIRTYDLLFTPIPIVARSKLQSFVSFYLEIVGVGPIPICVFIVDSSAAGVLSKFPRHPRSGGPSQLAPRLPSTVTLFILELLPLHLKRSAAEQAAHDARKAARRSKKDSRKRRRREQGEQDARKWASDEEDNSGTGCGPPPPPGPSCSYDPDAIRAEIEEARFRDKLWGALGDDERMDSVEARLNDYAHVPKRWRDAAGAASGIDDLDVDPCMMDDEEYAEWVRAGMWRKKHAVEHTEQQRQQAAYAAAQAQAAAREKALAAARQSKRRKRRERRARDTRLQYDQRWRELLPSSSSSSCANMPLLSFADIPWPILHDRAAEGNPTALQIASVEALTADAISSFLFLIDSQSDGDAAKKLRKERLRETMLRFHPDKFEGRIMRRVREEEQAAVREGVSAVAKFFPDRYPGIEWNDVKVDLSGKTVLTVGANTGLGFEAAKHFASMNPGKLVMGCRNADRGRKALEVIKDATGFTRIELRIIDLNKFSSVTEFADKYIKDGERLDIYVYNAGVYFPGYEATSDDWENMLQVNHLSCMLLSVLLLPCMSRTAAASLTRPRMVIVASEVHFWATLTNEEVACSNILEKLNDRDYCSPSLDVLSQSDEQAIPHLEAPKTVLNIFFVRELTARLYPNSRIIIDAVNPGYCKSELRRNLSPARLLLDRFREVLIGRPTEKGGRQLVWAAVGGQDKEDELRGAYVSLADVREPSDYVLCKDGQAAQIRLF